VNTLDIRTPRWGIPYLKPMRYKGLKGGRASAKSHFFAELAVESMLMDPYIDFVCLREILQSLKFSAKKLIELKIHTFGASKYFRILEHEIRRIGTDGTNTGIIIFQGMQDHTAESLKSLEGFNRAWFEEASRMSNRSLELLRPTIREEDSEIWFSWNPDQPTDPIEKFLVENTPENAIVHHLTYETNSFLPEVMREEARLWRQNDPESFAHVWLGEYNTKSDDQILGGKWRVEDFEVDPQWAGPYYGADWGFSSDPNAVIQCYVDDETNILYIRREFWELHVEIDNTEAFFDQMPKMSRAVIRADNARPEMISHMKRHNDPRIVAAEKWPGSVEDGISKLRSFASIVVHIDCPKTEAECRLYKYKRDRLTDDILPDIIDKHNHCIDAIRYAIEPLTKKRPVSFWDM
jgi:phage terminase large subunit